MSRHLDARVAIGVQVDNGADDELTVLPDEVRR
jgi:hypothetical protein